MKYVIIAAGRIENLAENVTKMLADHPGATCLGGVAIDHERGGNDYFQSMLMPAKRGRPDKTDQ